MCASNPLAPSSPATYAMFSKARGLFPVFKQWFVSAWIPVAPKPAMWVIIGALTAQLPLIISAIAFFDSLASCATSAG